MRARLAFLVGAFVYFVAFLALADLSRAGAVVFVVLTSASLAAVAFVVGLEIGERR